MRCGSSVGRHRRRVRARKSLDHRRLPRLLEQEAVVAVRRLDHVELDRPCRAREARPRAPRDPDGGYSQSELNAISSVRAETPRERPRERSAAVLPREIEVRQRPRRVEVGVGVEALDERVGLVAQVALDLELRLGERVADVVGELQPPAELVAERRAPTGR